MRGVRPWVCVPTHLHFRQLDMWVQAKWFFFLLLPGTYFGISNIENSWSGKTNFVRKLFFLFIAVKKKPHLTIRVSTMRANKHFYYIYHILQNELCFSLYPDILNYLIKTFFVEKFYQKFIHSFNKILEYFYVQFILLRDVKDS